MIASRRLVHAVWTALVVGSALVATPVTAHASPGTCKCNSGCHANPAQCVQGNGCSIGYVPSCGYRSASSGADCPKTDYISCNGDCTCTQIPNFCETVGGAEYCDAGPPDAEPDTYVPDTYVPDTYVPDTYVPDTYVPDTYEPDTYVPDTYVYVPPPDTYVYIPPPDTYVYIPPPDTYVAPPDTYVEDTYVPDTYVPDTYVEPPDTYVEDTYVPDTFVADTCAPLACPTGTHAIWIADQCDPFCAQPCGGGEFKCSWLAGTTCVDGFCVPSCLVTGCAACERCSLGDGKCFSEEASCKDGGASDSTTTAPPPPPPDDAGTAVDATIPDTGRPSTFVEADADTAQVGGCGCRLEAQTTSTKAGIVTFIATLFGVIIRRRRCVQRAASRTRSP